MNLEPYTTASDFLGRVRAFLEVEEPVNGLMLGLCLRLRDEPNLFGAPPFFAAVENRGQIVLACLMTPPYKLQLVGPEGVPREAFEIVSSALLDGKWPVPAVLARKDIAVGFADVFSEMSNVSWEEGMKQRIYELREVNPIPPPDGHVRPAGTDDLDLVVQWAHAFHQGIFGDSEPDRTEEYARRKVKDGTLFLWVDGEPVSMAARLRPTPHGESISYVYTPPEERRKGYATAIVASLARRILADGKRFCSLYTDLSNPTSNRIYTKIGFAPVADVIDVRFLPSTEETPE
jgi:predicted GNAT family acetyltransferase